MSSEMSPLTQANTRFAFDLLEKLSNADRTGNIFYSPFSISAALAMVRLGAAGNTETQISEMLHFSGIEPTQPEGHCQQQMQMQTTEQTTTQIEQSVTSQNDEVNVDQRFSELLQELNNPNDSYALRTANRLYGEKTFTFLERFLADTNNYFNAQLETVDFSAAAEAARIAINEWVKNQTEGKITNLLPEGSVNSLTKLVLVNAIYFKGKWLTQFKEEDTHDAPFQLNNNGDTKEVKMMQQTGDFLFHATDGIKMIELPYKGNDLSMIIILPDQIEDNTTGLEKAERELTNGKLEEWIRMMQRKKVAVSLPRFKMETWFELSQVLKLLGMVDAFDVANSDLSRMSGTRGLVVSAVVHKAFVEVNEEGTEAAAATGVVVGTTSITITIPIEFKADHPFLIFIRHKASKSILFAGRYSSPE